MALLKTLKLRGSALHSIYETLLTQYIFQLILAIPA